MVLHVLLRRLRWYFKQNGKSLLVAVQNASENEYFVGIFKSDPLLSNARKQVPTLSRSSL